MTGPSKFQAATDSTARRQFREAIQIIVDEARPGGLRVNIVTQELFERAVAPHTRFRHDHLWLARALKKVERARVEYERGAIDLADMSDEEADRYVEANTPIHPADTEVKVFQEAIRGICDTARQKGLTPITISDELLDYALNMQIPNMLFGEPWFEYALGRLGTLIGSQECYRAAIAELIDEAKAEKQTD